jgi:hypothetical protein
MFEPGAGAGYFGGMRRHAPMTTFKSVAAAKWQLESNVGTGRKSCLLKTSFRSIVEQVTNKTALRDYGREKIRKFPGSKRVWIKLVLPRRVIDLFHNGAGGYRAQFYISVEQGEAANRYLINALHNRLKSLCKIHKKRGCDWEFVAASLRDPDAKVWIHQGTWLRAKKLNDRNLKVERWLQHERSQNSKIRAKAIWAQLTPNGETVLEIMGGCVDSNLKSIGKELKPKRSQELHRFGFT